jgi:hypothetical protein
MTRSINKKIILALLLLFLLPGSLFAFKSAGLGFGPVFNLRGGMSTSYLITGEWNLHKNIGARLFLGFVNGFWIGTALNASFSVFESKDRKFDWSINFSIPFIINIYNGVKTAFMGLTFGNSLSLSLDPSCKYYFFVSPAEFVLIPVTWGLSPSTGFNSGMGVSLAFSLGFRVRL